MVAAVAAASACGRDSGLTATQPTSTPPLTSVGRAVAVASLEVRAVLAVLPPLGFDPVNTVGGPFPELGPDGRTVVGRLDLGPKRLGGDSVEAATVEPSPVSGVDEIRLVFKEGPE